uniref:Dirigent protein n=1 Tax=Tetradesmus obliquus TaxID=3088 RepID=A0A383WL51_TETOB|eukprot:jgi/Sobl393_1/11731/SZX77844.1
MALELGPNGDDTIFTLAALDRADFTGKPTDIDAAVVGGTGRYKGATGESVVTGMDVTKGDNLHVAEVAVPRFKRF